jgi:hypothetical protein
MSSQLPRVCWYCQLPEVVCQNCWLPTERNQLSDGGSVSESSFVWFPPFLFYFPCSISVPQEMGNKVTTHWAPYLWKALIQWGAAQCSEGIANHTAVTTSVPGSPWHDTSHLGFGGPEPCSLSRVVTPSLRQGCHGLDFGGELLTCYVICYKWYERH